MTHKRAVILETDGRVARVFASGGEFRTVKAPPGAGVGDEIDIAGVTPFSVWRPRLALVAVLAAVLIFGGAGLNGLAGSFNHVTAYVTLDINPSIEFAVNRWGCVIGARGLNSEGTELLAAAEYRGRRLAEVVPELTRLATEQGYIADGKPNAVIVAAAPATPTTPLAPIQQEVERAKEQTSAAVTAAAGPPVTVTSIVTPDETLRDEAKALDLSLGKLAVVLEARESGVPVRVSDVERDGLAKALESAGGKLAELATKAHDESDYEKLTSQYSEQLRREKTDDDSKGRGNGHGSGATAGTGGGASTAGTGGAAAPAVSGAGNGSQPGTDGQGGAADNQPGEGSGNTGGDSGNGSGNGNGRRDAGPGNQGGNGSRNGGKSGREDDSRDNSSEQQGKLTGRIRDGLRELGERIKHGFDQGK